jgi:hypothetical protein
MGHLSTGKSLLNKIITSISIDSRAKKKKKCHQSTNQVNSEYSFLWPLCIKLDIMTVFVDATDKKIASFFTQNGNF